MKTTRLVEAGKVPTGGGLVDAARRKLVAEVARNDTCLARILSRPSVSSLDSDAFARLSASVADDRALLDEISTRARSASTLAGLLSVATSLHRVRPEIYSVAVGQVQDLTALTGRAEANAASLAEFEAVVTQREAAGHDVTSVRIDLMAARLVNAEAALGIPAARDTTLDLTGRSTRAELQAVVDEVPRISGLLDRVDETVLLVELALGARVVGPRHWPPSQGRSTVAGPPGRPDPAPSSVRGPTAHPRAGSLPAWCCDAG